MEVFKTLEDKLAYVEALVSVATQNEKITDSQKLLIYSILNNYGISHEYADEIWKRIKQKKSLEQILAGVSNQDMNVKLLLVQELIASFIMSNRYHKEKSTLIEVCKLLGITVKLEALKDHVLEVIETNKKQTK